MKVTSIMLLKTHIENMSETGYSTIYMKIKVVAEMQRRAASGVAAGSPQRPGLTVGFYHAHVPNIRGWLPPQWNTNPSSTQGVHYRLIVRLPGASSLEVSIMGRGTMSAVRGRGLS